MHLFSVTASNILDSAVHCGFSCYDTM